MNDKHNFFIELENAHAHIFQTTLNMYLSPVKQKNFIVKQQKHKNFELLFRVNYVIIELLNTDYSDFLHFKFKSDQLYFGCT